MGKPGAYTAFPIRSAVLLVRAFQTQTPRTLHRQLRLLYAWTDGTQCNISGSTTSPAIESPSFCPFMLMNLALCF